MVARHVAEPRQLGGAAPLLPALDHYHRTDEVQPRRGADKQRRQTDGGEQKAAETAKQRRQARGGGEEETAK